MSRSALVVNCSAPAYNLGALKLRDWLASEGWTVDLVGGDPGLFCYGHDLVALSVIFSWHAPVARDIALRVRDTSQVWAGGPGLFALAGWWKRETGLNAHAGLDPRFDRQHGGYRMTFASRGCPVGCYFCIVPRLEGKQFTLDWEFRAAPVLCDNNLSALPTDFQRHIVARYRETGMVLKDANSGFEPRTFTAETRAIWEPVLRGPWRFAFDEMGEESEVRAMMALLSDVSPRRKQVYVLAGNECIASCYERTQKVIEWGGEPFVQYVLPLNWLGDPDALKHRHDWTWQLGQDFRRYYNRHLWRSVPLRAYSNRQKEPPPFREVSL